MLALCKTSVEAEGFDKALLDLEPVWDKAQKFTQWLEISDVMKDSVHHIDSTIASCMYVVAALEMKSLAHMRMATRKVLRTSD